MPAERMNEGATDITDKYKGEIATARVSSIIGETLFTRQIIASAFDVTMFEQKCSIVGRLLVRLRGQAQNQT